MLYSFNSISKTNVQIDSLENMQNSYALILISLDQQINEYSRSLYSLWDMLGYIGGIYGHLKTAGYFIFGFLIKQNFYMYIISELYHLEAGLDNRDDNFNKSEIKNQNCIDENSMIIQQPCIALHLTF